MNKHQNKILGVVAFWFMAAVVIVASITLWYVSWPKEASGESAPSPLCSLRDVVCDYEIEEPIIDISILDRIAWCESRGDYEAQSPDSTAYGKYQIINSTWNEMAKITGMTDKRDPLAQEANAVKLYELRGTRPWNESKHCWQTI